MKKLYFMALIGMGSLLAGCVSVNGPVMGGTINLSKESIATTDKTAYSKTGVAECTGVLGFAWGDCSTKAAAENGGITEIIRVDGEPLNILSVYAKYTTTVYGN